MMPANDRKTCLKGLASTSANEQVQMRPHVGKAVDPDPKRTGHRAKRVAHGTLVLRRDQGPRPSGSSETTCIGLRTLTGRSSLRSPRLTVPPCSVRTKLGVQVTRE